MEKGLIKEFLDKLIPELEILIGKGNEPRSIIRSISPLLYDFKFEEKKFNKWDDSNLDVLIHCFINLFYGSNHFGSQIDSIDSRPYWQFKTILDPRSNKLDHQLNDLVYRYDSPFWRQFYPPNYWECRGWIRALTEKQITEMGLTISTIIPEHPYPDFAVNFYKGNLSESFTDLCIKLLSERV